jgi:hypothetical protein
MGSNAVVAAIIVMNSDAALAGKDPARVKLTSSQAAKMTDSRIGKEF